MGSRKNSRGQWLWCVHGHSDGNRGGRGGRILGALRWSPGRWRHYRHNPGCRDWGSASNDSCWSRERPEDLRPSFLRAAAVGVLKTREIPNVSSQHAWDHPHPREHTFARGLGGRNESSIPGWRAVSSLDGYELGRKLRKANWNFFYLAGAIRVSAFGRVGKKTLQQAARGILVKLKGKGKEFNSLEITGVIAKRFLGVPFLSVTANSRHIQESFYLVPVQGLASRAALPTKLNSSERLHRGEVLVKHDAALV
jgi:hypothetical protein